MPELEPEESLEEEEPPPTRPLHQSPPELLALELPLSEVLPGSSAGVSGTGSGPALTVTLTRLFTLTVEPAAGSCPMMVPAGLSLYCSVVLPRPSLFCTSRVRASFTLDRPTRDGTLAVVLTCGRLT